MTKPYEKRIKLGIKWLDETFGRRKWVKKIDLKKFDIRETNTCVIGEVLGSYIKGYDYDDFSPEEMGFNYYTGGSSGWSRLNTSWKFFLKKLGAK